MLRWRTVKESRLRVVSRVVLGTLVWLAPHVARADSIAVGDTIVFQQAYTDGNTGAGPFITTVNDDPSTAFVTFCVQPDVGTWADLGTTQYVAGVSDSSPGNLRAWEGCGRQELLDLADCVALHPVSRRYGCPGMTSR